MPKQKEPPNKVLGFARYNKEPGGNLILEERVKIPMKGDTSMRL
jgi:hypothetical protein